MTSDPCCLVTDIPPCSNYSGGIFLDHMLRSMGGQIRAGFVVLSRFLSPELSPLAASMQLLTVPKPDELHSATAPRESVRMAELQCEAHVREQILPCLLEFASRFHLKSFWVLLEGQTMIRLAHQLIQNTQLPVFAQVMDPPRNWFRVHGVDPDSENELLEQFETVLRRCCCCATASWSMATAYAEQFGIPCVPVVPSLPQWVSRRPVRNVESGLVFRLGIAGQLYARDEWQRLLRVLDSCDWQIGRARVEVHAFTTDRAVAISEGRVIGRGWLTNTEELLEALSELDLLYLPYRFADEHLEEASLCFPSKLTTYFATGKPVLLHGPAASSPVHFVKERGAGFCCSEPSDEDLLDTLTRAVGNPDEAQAAAWNGTRAFDDYLTYRTLAASIRQVLAHTAGRHE